MRNKMKKTKLAIFKLILLAMCYFILTAGNAHSQNIKFDYLIGPEDVLRVYVWNHPELSLSVPVRIDGKISLPLINDVMAQGITPMELKETITGKLSKYIEQPTVSIIIEAINSQKIVIVGQVNAPGVYKVGSLMTLMEAISKGGGLNEWANAKKIKVFRKEKDKEKVMTVNYDKLIKGEDMKNNIYVMPGDTIIVP